MLKCNPLRWLWGLLPLTLLWWVGVLGMQQRIEEDLAQRTNQHLAQNNLGWASVVFKGRDGMLVGRAEEESEQRRPAIEAAKVWGVRTLEDRIEVLQLVKNYVWNATTREGTLALSGYVPNEAARKAILASARRYFPKHQVEDKMDLARGAPDQKVWLGGTAFALRQLAALKPGGRAGLEAAGLVIAGEADSSKGYETVRNDLGRALPQGVSLKADRVIPPVVKPFSWAAQLRGRQLELTGHVPSVAARDQIKAAAAAALPGGSVVDRMTLASGAPADWQKVASMAIARLGQLKQGNAELIDQRLSVTGLTETESMADTVRAALKKDTPAGYRLSEEIRQDPVVKAAEEARRAAEEAQREAARRAAAEAEARRAADQQRQLTEAQTQARAAEEAARRRAEEESKRAADERRAAEEAQRKAAQEAEARRLADEQARRAREEQERAARAKAQAEAAQRARAAEASRCQTSLRQATEAGTITFKRASAELDRQSHKTLDALAQIIKGCPGFEVEVGGHTDNEGEPDRNQRLSDRRAKSVLDYLVKAGVPPATLSAVGYGQEKPRVPNDSPTNMALNRRIEFSVKAK
jgi:outer membrane protein OmpA-like peptidoglycan-associated protein